VVKDIMAYDLQASLRSQFHAARKGSFRNQAASENTPLLDNIRTNTHEPHHIWGEDDTSPFTAYPKKFLHLTWLTLASNYVNVLLVFVPIGIVTGALEMDPILVFSMNFLAIVPLASLLSFATEELSSTLGQTAAGLMNASFGNAVELIVRFSLCLQDKSNLLESGEHNSSS
jgi:Ca2+:H+ antiporter